MTVTGVCQAFHFIHLVLIKGIMIFLVSSTILFSNIEIQFVIPE